MLPHEPHPPAHEGPPFATRDAVLRWLEQHGMGHVAYLSLAVVADAVDPALGPTVRATCSKRYLTDLAAAATRERLLPLLPAELRSALPEAVATFLREEQTRVEEARAEVPQRLAADVPAEGEAMRRRLLALRERFPESVAPRRDADLEVERLRFDADAPGFHFRDRRATRLRGPSTRFAPPKVSLTVRSEPMEHECTCGARFCEHALAAIDTALAWLGRPLSTKTIAALERLEAPGWARTLAALDRAIEGDASEHAAVQVMWHVHLLDDVRVEVTPWVHKRDKRGQLGAGRPTFGARLRLELGTSLSAADARVLALLPEPGEPASAMLLEALVGHPRLVRGYAPDRAIQIARAPVGLVAEDRGGSLCITAALDGTPLPADRLERIVRAELEDIAWVDEGHRVTLLDVGDELRAVLQVLHREGNVFPPESRSALIASLGRWAERMPIAMPHSVLGTQVVPEPRMVLRLTAYAKGAVHVEVRVRPLPEGPTFEPGRGPPRVYVRRAGRPIHATRSFEREMDATQELLEAIGIEAAEPLELGQGRRLPDAHAALAMLTMAQGVEPAPELEWVGRPLRIVPSPGEGALRIVIERRRNWFGALGELAVAGERVELARLLDAARRHERHVEVDSHTFVELSALLLRHLERLAEHTHVGARGVELAGSAVPTLIALESAGAMLEVEAAWRSLAERYRAAIDRTFTPPSELTTVLRPYQARGFEWMAKLAAWGAGGILADDMGLGKTVQALALLLERRAAGPALVLAPTSVIHNWVAEAERFAPALRVMALSDQGDRELVLARLGPGDVLVVGYGLLVRELPRLSGIAFATAIFDEAQNLKNPKAQRTRAARSLRAEAKIALSGTPLENHPGELWSLFSVVFPSLFGTWETFHRRFALPLEHGLDPRATEALAHRIAPFVLRRTKAEVEVDLPPRTEIRVPVVLSRDEWQLYEDARLATLSDLESRAEVLRDQERRVEVLAALTRLRLLASHPRLYDARCDVPSTKLARFLELVRALQAQGQRALVFSQFTTLLALVREALEARAVPYVYLDGQTPAKQRADRVRAFQEGDAPLFLISLKAGGVGLNLTAATNVIHLDPWWNPAVEDQASDRAHRLGQARPVTIYRLVAVGTIEEQMLALHGQKRKLVDQVLRGATEDAGPLSTEALLELLATSRGSDSAASPRHEASSK